MSDCLPHLLKKAKVTNDGLKVVDVEEAAKIGDFIMILVPDQLQPMVYKQSIEPNLEEGNVLMFAHGFNINYAQIIPPKSVDVIMVALRDRVIPLGPILEGKEFLH